ncbi:MAG: VWA domain-containing protein, partial [Chitinophagia bacterium]|nr:VWA domain-containing protein [Chitinophagia bacterium]
MSLPEVKARKPPPMNFRPLVIALCTLSALFAGDALSQGSVTLDVTVIDNQGRILAGLPVVMRERATASEVRTRTDAAGTARFKLSSGKQWLVYVDGRRYGSDFIDIVDGSEVEQSMIITHDPAYDDRIARQSFRRDTLTETDIRSAPLPSSSLPGHTLLEVVVRNSGGVVLPGMRVRVVDLAASSAWWKLSDAAGRVVFHLPVGRSYDIDVEDQLNATYFDPVSMGEGRSMTSRLTMTYDRYQVSEQRRGDTIRQRVAAGEPLRHSKGLLRLHVERDHMAAAGETVYINDVRSSRVWEAVTDSAGETVFVLPFGTRYLVHFRYQRDVEAVDFTRARKQAEAALGLTYTPDPEQEHPGRFVPVQWRNSVWPFDRYRRSPYPDSESGKGPRMVLRASGPVRAGRVSGILQAGIRIPTLDASAVGPLNIGFVLDISGSMASEDNIERMKAGVIQMLQAMRPDDVVSITLFDDKPELLLPAQRLGKDLPRIAALVRTLAPRGGTVVSEALRVAARQVASGKADGASPNLVLVTDGWIFDPIDSVLQLFKGDLAGLPCIPVGTGKLSNA